MLAHRLALEADPARRRELADRFRAAEQDYLRAYDQWTRDLPDGPVKQTQRTEAHPMAVEFFEVANREFLPAALAGPAEQPKAVAVLNGRMTDLFDRQRLAAGKPETGTIRLEARHHTGMLDITVSDDGRGVDLDRLRRKVTDRGLASADMAARLSEAELLDFLFLPGFSTADAVTDVSGRGAGLDVVQSTAQAVGGAIRVSTRPGDGTTFELQLPITLSVLRAVLVRVAGDPYALPLNRTDRLLRLPDDRVRALEGKPHFEVDGRHVGLVPAHQVLDLPAGAPSGDELAVVLIGDRRHQYGLLVEGFLGEQDLVVRPLDPRLGKVPNVAAASVLEDGSPVLIVDVDDVARSVGMLVHLELVRAVRADPRVQSTPVVIVSYEERDEERARGLDAGANYYLTERSFHDGQTLAAVKELIGGPEGNCRGAAMRIAIVDDRPLAREAVRGATAGVPGYQVAWVARDGEEAVRLCAADRPDLVLMDLVMPGVNGAEATRRIMAASPCPVLVVTATVSGNCGLVYEALAAGAVGAVNTPVLGTDGSPQGAADLLAKVAQVERRLRAAEARSPGLLPRVTAAPPLVAIGASTGGPQALADLLAARRPS